VIYNIAARRDYSFFGQYVLVWLFTALTTLVYTWLSDIVISLASASFIVFSVALFCYLYDLSMILRRRLPKETVVGALDLYRDALNFVGFPVRVMRRPRGLRRNRT
jgi:FtsH-binding integral membrane protein